jgi:multicomponent Na+:H+ antiporter subunit D
MLAAVILLLATGFVAGVAPPFAHAAGDAAAALTDHRGYVGHVLRGSTSAPTAAFSPEWTVSGLLLGVVSAALATAIALATIYAGRLPSGLRARARVLHPVQSALHHLHSGHVGDYAAWVILGAAALAGLLAIG